MRGLGYDPVSDLPFFLSFPPQPGHGPENGDSFLAPLPLQVSSSPGISWTQGMCLSPPPHITVSDSMIQFVLNSPLPPTIYPQQACLPSSISVMGCDYPDPGQASAPSMGLSLLSASTPSPAVLGGPPRIPRMVLSGANSGC